MPRGLANMYTATCPQHATAMRQPAPLPPFANGLCINHGPFVYDPCAVTVCIKHGPCMEKPWQLGVQGCSYASALQSMFTLHAKACPKTNSALMY